MDSTLTDMLIDYFEAHGYSWLSSYIYVKQVAIYACMLRCSSSYNYMYFNKKNQCVTYLLSYAINYPIVLFLILLASYIKMMLAYAYWPHPYSSSALSLSSNNWLIDKLFQFNNQF